MLKWIDDCPNDLFSALTYQGGSEWRKTLITEFKNNKQVISFINNLDDKSLHELMTNLAGHDLNSLEEAFLKYMNDDRPTCFICYTVKGFGLPLAGHKDNHSGIMNLQQFELYQKKMKIDKGNEWKKTEGLNISKKEFNKIMTSNPLAEVKRELSDEKIRTLLSANHMIKVARRTVTKYREEAGIGSTRVRKD